jgi:hypothetical protein
MNVILIHQYVNNVMKMNIDYRLIQIHVLLPQMLELKEMIVHQLKDILIVHNIISATQVQNALLVPQERKDKYPNQLQMLRQIVCVQVVLTLIKRTLLELVVYQLAVI